MKIPDGLDFPSLELLVEALCLVRAGLTPAEGDPPEQANAQQKACNTLDAAVFVIEQMREWNGASYCAFCGSHFQEESFESSELVQAHIRVCDKHPLGEEIRRLTREREALLRFCYREVSTREDGRYFRIVVDTVDRQARWYETVEDVERTILSLAMEAG